MMTKLIPPPVRAGLKRIPGMRSAVGWLRTLTWKFYCPVCRQRVDAFRPLDKSYLETKKKHGWPYKPEDSETINVSQYGCPHCGASDRYRLYALYLSQKLPAAFGARGCDLLEFAPHQAFGRFLQTFPGIRYRTADLFMEGVDDRMDVTDMNPYPEGRFDVFICSHVLEHVADDQQALKELFRILKPGGWGILMVPINLVAKEIDEDPRITDEHERWRRFGQNDHVRLYTKNGFLDRVGRAGFEIHQYGMNHFGVRSFARHGITPQSVLYIVEKKQPCPTCCPK
jgi:SAM-dependent methyltransferase